MTDRERETEAIKRQFAGDPVTMREMLAIAAGGGAGDVVAVGPDGRPLDPQPARGRRPGVGP